MNTTCYVVCITAVKLIIRGKRLQWVGKRNRGAQFHYTTQSSLRQTSMGCVEIYVHLMLRANEQFNNKTNLFYSETKKKSVFSHKYLVMWKLWCITFVLYKSYNYLCKWINIYVWNSTQKRFLKQINKKCIKIVVMLRYR